eukprot:s1425_g2.t1
MIRRRRIPARSTLSAWVKKGGSFHLSTLPLNASGKPSRMSMKLSPGCKTSGPGMDGRMDGWTDGRMDGWTDGWTDGRMEGWRDGGMEGWRDGGMEGWRDGGMEGWRDGGMEGWMDGWMDGQKQGQIHRSTILLGTPTAVCKTLALRSLGNWVTVFNRWQEIGKWVPGQARGGRAAGG